MAWVGLSRWLGGIERGDLPRAWFQEEMDQCLDTYATGLPTTGEIERLEANLCRQITGRCRRVRAASDF